MYRDTVINYLYACATFFLLLFLIFSSCYPIRVHGRKRVLYVGVCPSYIIIKKPPDETWTVNGGELKTYCATKHLCPFYGFRYRFQENLTCVPMHPRYPYNVTLISFAYRFLRTRRTDLRRIMLRRGWRIKESIGFNKIWVSISAWRNCWWLESTMTEIVDKSLKKFRGVFDVKGKGSFGGQMVVC